MISCIYGRQDGPIKAKGVIVTYPDNPIPRKDREFIPRDATVRIIAEKLGSIGISLPVTESDFEKVSEFFSSEEATWANAAACGDAVRCGFDAGRVVRRVRRYAEAYLFGETVIESVFMYPGRSAVNVPKS